MLERKGRILFYYHHFGGLGHGTRIAAICKALKEINQCEIVVINSGKKQPELGIQEYAPVINLPFFEAGHGLFAGLKADEGVDVRFKKRSNILNKVRQQFKPDVAVFEHFPFGRNSLAQEISSFIGLLRADGCRIYSSVRDIIDQPIDVEELSEHLKLFNGILVHSDKQMGFVTSFKQPEELKEKIFFTGRVAYRKKMDLVNKTEIRKPFDLAGRKWIVISVGGGIDGEKIVGRLIGIKKSLDKRISNSFLIAAGPNISPVKYNELKKKAEGQKGIVITRFDADYVQYVHAADLSISMGGYNSINNALLTGTSTIIFPRLSDGEQKKRAEYFSKYVELMDEAIPDEELVEKILFCIGKPRFVYPVEMRGAEVTARLLDAACDINSMKIRLDTECNLTCEMCSWKKQTIALPKDSLKKLILRARIIGVRVIAVTGGEPTMLPGIKDNLKFIKDNGLRVSLSTNGYLEPARLKELIPYIDVVDISMDSADEALHDRIRGKVGAFNVTMGSIRLLAEANLRPHINVTIRPDNFRGLHRMVPLFAGYSDSMSFTLVDTNMIKKRTERYIFSEEQLVSFYFDEIILILKGCIKNKIRIRITPFFDDLAGKSF
ncbi:MAG: radical SAM protein [Candidatus Omnitrophica bacterium]|nr:radical SAM protein [Candidatus Omnitrophota bacterium]